MKEYTLYYRGWQIDNLMAETDTDAINEACERYGADDFGESVLQLYRNVNGAGIHIARITTGLTF